MLGAARRRAAAAGVPFGLTVDDIVIPDRCPVLGIQLIPQGTCRDFAPSLDRIIPELGYVPGNIAVTSMRANRLKSDATATELAAILAYVLRAAPAPTNRRPRRAHRNA